MLFNYTSNDAREIFGYFLRWFTKMKLNAEGLLRLLEVREELRVSWTRSSNLSNSNSGEVSQILPEESESNLPVTEAESSDQTKSTVPQVSSPSQCLDIKSMKSTFLEYLLSFVSDRLKDTCLVNVSSFLDGIPLLNVDNPDNLEIAFDLLLQNHIEFLKALQHPNWHWTSLMENDLLRNFFLRDLIPKSTDPQCTILFLRITLKLFCLAIRDQNTSVSEEFLAILLELCQIKDFAAAFLWVFLQLLASKEMLPYLAGGSCTISTFSSESSDSEKFMHLENSRSLSAPSLLQSRPEPRMIRSKPRIGTFQAKPIKVTLKVLVISTAHAATNVSLATDVVCICCEKISLKVNKELSVVVPLKPELPKPQLHDSPDSPTTGGHLDISPASPPADATGSVSESPASPESPDMITSRIPTEEKMPNRFRVEFKDLAMKVTLIAPDDVTVNESNSCLLLRSALHALGGWCWLSVCLVDVFNPEESDKTIPWPEFQTVAFFNRNVHVVNAFCNNPVWMKILEIASHSEAFVYFSPVIRPIYISLCTHWETCMEKPIAARNDFAREQTVWLIQCLSRGKMLHEPYCFLGSILEFLAPHEISSIFASLWKVIKTYLPNPHGLLQIPESEQDFRARQMAETDCLLKIRAVCFSRLPEMKLLAKRFFMSARVPLEESRWYESVQSQETASAPAPIDASHLARVD